ncbi:hypothetical protein [Methanocaldococcus sp.]
MHLLPNGSKCLLAYSGAERSEAPLYNASFTLIQLKKQVPAP